MSGRKQHYIPQFVIKPFAESAGGRKPQVRVTRRDKTFVVPTDGIAASKDFYSRPDDGPVSLDEVITQEETRYAEIHSELIRASADVQVDKGRALALLGHLSIRGHNFRGATSAFGHLTIKRLAEHFADPSNFKRFLGVGTPRLTPMIEKRVDEFYNHHKKELARKRISRFDLKRLAKRQIEDTWINVFVESAPTLAAVAGAFDFQRMAAEAHNEALTTHFEPSGKIQGLSGLDWCLVDIDEPKFCLPDGVALAHFNKTGVMPLGFVGNDELSGVIFPLSPTRALCGGIYCSDPLISTLSQDFGLFCALASWDFVLTSPSYPLDYVPPANIGDAIFRMMMESMEEAMAESILDFG